MEQITQLPSFLTNRDLPKFEIGEERKVEDQNKADLGWRYSLDCMWDLRYKTLRMLNSIAISVYTDCTGL